MEFELGVVSLADLVAMAAGVTGILLGIAGLRGSTRNSERTRRGDMALAYSAIGRIVVEGAQLAATHPRDLTPGNLAHDAKACKRIASLCEEGRAIIARALPEAWADVEGLAIRLQPVVAASALDPGREEDLFTLLAAYKELYRALAVLSHLYDEREPWAGGTRRFLGFPRRRRDVATGFWGFQLWFASAHENMLPLMSLKSKAASE